MIYVKIGVIIEETIEFKNKKRDFRDDIKIYLCLQLWIGKDLIKLE